MKDSFRKPVVNAVAGLALLIGAYAGNAEAAITLGESNQQNSYSIVEDSSTTGYDIKVNLNWANNSTYVPANNQISANGLLGNVDSGLYNISTTDDTHDRDPPTYSIFNNSFNIAYASGVVNTPGNTDTFEFRFNLGDATEEQANAVVSELNQLISGAMQIGDSQYALERTINGTVSYDGITPKPFENSPLVYVPNASAVPEPATMGLLGIGAIAGLAVRKLKRVYSLAT